MGNSKGKMKLFAILAVTATATPFVKPSCQDQCMEWAKKEASKNCKKGDYECMNKYKQMGKKCVNEKCNDFAEFVEAMEKPSCEDQCVAWAKKQASKECKKGDKECMQKFQKIGKKCVADKCNAIFDIEEFKKRDKDCMEKFQKMGKKCVADKCKKPEKPEKPSCEDQCLAAAKKEATANCKKEDKECYQKYQKM